VACDRSTGLSTAGRTAASGTPGSQCTGGSAAAVVSRLLVFRLLVYAEGSTGRGGGAPRRAMYELRGTATAALVSTTISSAPPARSALRRQRGAAIWTTGCRIASGGSVPVGRVLRDAGAGALRSVSGGGSSGSG